MRNVYMVSIEIWNKIDLEINSIDVTYKEKYYPYMPCQALSHTTLQLEAKYFFIHCFIRITSQDRGLVKVQQNYL